MKNNCKIWVYLAAALITLLLSACSDDGNKKTVGTADTSMLLDGEATPAPHTLIRLQERQMFPVDDRKREYAIIEDRDDKQQTSNKPLSIQESER